MLSLSDLARKKIWLAPLAGITDNSFRSVCKNCGADVVVSEMVSADGLIRNPEKCLRYIRFGENQHPFGVQIFGKDPGIMKKAISRAIQTGADFIDVNMGCPVKKVVKRGAGVALMQNPQLAVSIISAMKKELQGTGILLSVKIRSGWDNFSSNAVEFALKLQQAGIDMICLHPRTRSQMYAGKSDWNLIKTLKQALNIPVIGNGDIRNPEDALKMFETTGCDSIMIGRGAMGKPWIFREIKSALKNLEIEKIWMEEKFELIRKHVELTVKDKGESVALREMRTHFSCYTRGFKGGAKIRDYINRSLDMEDILDMIKKLYLTQTMR